LQQVIPTLLQLPAKVEHLQLTLDAWVPEATLKRFVSWHTLKVLDLRATRIRTRALSDPRYDRQPTSRYQKILVEEHIIRIVPFVSASVETLKLVDCDMQTYRIPALCQLIRKRRQLQSLGLHHSRHVDGGCFEDLLSLPGLESLDLSICDFWTLPMAIYWRMP
jgi:hypothetical protein